MVLLLVLAAAAAQTTSTPLYVDGVLRVVTTFHRMNEGSLPASGSTESFGTNVYPKSSAGPTVSTDGSEPIHTNRQARSKLSMSTNISDPRRPTANLTGNPFCGQHVRAHPAAFRRSAVIRNLLNDKHGFVTRPAHPAN
jgi:hypothetical protein